MPEFLAKNTIETIINGQKNVPERFISIFDNRKYTSQNSNSY